jgi:hypothetical protein
LCPDGFQHLVSGGLHLRIIEGSGCGLFAHQRLTRFRVRVRFQLLNRLDEAVIVSEPLLQQVL